MRKTLLPLLLILILALCACGTGTPAATTAPTSEPTVQATNAPETTPESESPSDDADLPTETDATTDAAYPMTLTDMMGREVAIEAEPARIVSLTPTNTELVYALGLEGRLVGVDSYSDYPEAALSIEKIGDYSSISVEAVLAAEPDIVLAGDKLQQETIDRLSELGLTVMACEASSFDTIGDSITLIARATGVQGAADALLADFSARRDAVVQRVQGLDAPTVYFAISYGEWGDYTVGMGSYIGDIVALAGGVNVAAEVPTPWPSYSIEQLIADDPDFIVINGEQSMADEFVALENYRELRAVSEGRVYAVDANIFNRPSDRAVEALEILAGLLHPAE